PGQITIAGTRSDSQALNAPYPKGITTITWTATDTSGNSAQCTQTVTVTDDENPTITCPGTVTVNADSGSCQATGVNIGTGAANVTCVPASGSAFPKGTTTVNCTADDGNGNSASCSFRVTVADHQNPTITATANLTDVPTDTGKCYATGVALGAPTTGDNCP